MARNFPKVQGNGGGNKPNSGSSGGNNKKKNWRFVPPNEGDPETITKGNVKYKFCAKCKSWTFGDKMHSTSEHKKKKNDNGGTGSSGGGNNGGMNGQGSGDAGGNSGSQGGALGQIQPQGGGLRLMGSLLYCSKINNDVSDRISIDKNFDLYPEMKVHEEGHGDEGDCHQSVGIFERLFHKTKALLKGQPRHW